MNKKQTKRLINFYKKHTILCDKLSGGDDFNDFVLFYWISKKQLTATQRRMLLTSTTFSGKQKTRLEILYILRNDFRAKYYEKVNALEDFHAIHGY